nr:3-oxo-5-alpha-steroid 4-dehydrogenase 2-like isoform X4 [Nerophis lumbriciformis]
MRSLSVYLRHLTIIALGRGDCRGGPMRWARMSSGGFAAKAGNHLGMLVARTFIYSLLTKGKPFPQDVMLGAGFFCSVNGFLQGHYLLHCAQLDEQMSDCCVRIGLLLFYTGMAINIHSDYSLRNLRKPGEAIYKVPTGGFFEYVSAANYFGEILEWFGYAVATWGLPSFSFAVFTACFIGPRAIYHHRWRAFWGFLVEQCREEGICRSTGEPNEEGLRCGSTNRSYQQQTTSDSSRQHQTAADNSRQQQTTSDSSRQQQTATGRRTYNTISLQ